MLRLVLAELACLAALVLSFAGARRLFRDRWPWRIALSGFLVPVIVGIAVRQYLAAMGKPVMAWSWILGWLYHPGQLAGLLILLAYWDLPFLVVAWVAVGRPMKLARNRAVVYGGFAGALLATIVIFADLWRNTEAVVMMGIVIPLFTVPGALVGLAAGWLFARAFASRTGPPGLAHS